MFNLFVTKNFFISFFIIMLAAISLYVIGDFTSRVDFSTLSTRTLTLFFIYDIQAALSETFMLSLLFGTVLFVSTILRKNEFLALISIGYSKKKIGSLIFVITSLISIAYIALSASTDLIYAKDNARYTIKGDGATHSKEMIFTKYGDYYVYFDKFFPLINTANNVRIYEVKDETLHSLIKAKNAHFEGDSWVLYDNTILKVENNKTSVEHVPKVKALKNFKPIIIDKLYDSKNAMSLQDSVNSLMFLNSQKEDTTKIRAMIYNSALIPLFAPFLCFFFVVKAPIMTRYFSVGKYIFYASTIALSFWVMVHALANISMGGLVYPEVGIMLPMIVLVTLTFMEYKSTSD